MRKKELKKVVCEWRIPANRRKDPKGLQLAEDSAALSLWEREVATERGIKYCETKWGYHGHGICGLTKLSRGTLVGWVTKGTLAGCFVHHSARKIR